MFFIAEDNRGNIGVKSCSRKCRQYKFEKFLRTLQTGKCTLLLSFPIVQTELKLVKREEEIGTQEYLPSIFP